MTSSSQNSLNQEDVSRAVRELDLKKLTSLLLAASSKDRAASAVAKALKMAGGLVYREAVDSAVRNRRDEFLDAVRGEFRDSTGEVDESVQAALDQIRVAQLVYDEIQTLASARRATTPTTLIRAAAALAFAGGGLQKVKQALNEAVAAMEYIPERASVFMEGQEVNPDALAAFYVEYASWVLKVVARESGWVDSGDKVSLPSLPAPTSRALEETAEMANIFAMSNRWRALEDEARFLGGYLLDVTPNNAPAGKRYILQSVRATVETPHLIARMRAESKLFQNLFDNIEFLKQIPDQPNIEHAAKLALPPKQVVSHLELHAIESLSWQLAFDICTHQEVIGGATLVEWVRAYCALQVLANQVSPGRVVRKSAGDWARFLVNMGLSEGASTHLVSHLTFSSTSDLYDQPLIRVGEQLLFFHPSLQAANIVEVVHSTLAGLRSASEGSAKKKQLARKGKAFEAVIRELLASELGCPVYAFTVIIDGKQFEYDALLVWGEYVFVFECKSRLLPTRASQTAQFERRTAEYVEQTSKLVGALREHPDVFREHLGDQLTGKTVVGVLLNSVPFCSEPADEVCIYDYSALGLFLRRGTVDLEGVESDSKFAAPIIRLWSGDRPAAEDLVSQLRNPIQFSDYVARLEQRSDVLHIGGVQVQRLEPHIRPHPALAQYLKQQERK